MPDLRFLVVPGVLLAAAVGYVAANPTGAVVEEPVPPQVEPTATPRPTYTPTATPTPIPSDALLPGLSGRLTYHLEDGQFVAVDFPSGQFVEPPIIPSSLRGSSDGLWHEEYTCNEHTGCRLSFFTTDGRSSSVPGSYFVTYNSLWQPGAHVFAFAAAEAADAPASRIMIVDNPELPSIRVLYDAGDAELRAFAWSGDQLLVARGVETGTQLLHVNRTGSIEPLADIAGAVEHLYPSPDGHTFAFTLSDPSGWRLLTVDARSGSVTDLGNMGSDGPGATPVAVPPDGAKSPMYIAWSPDGAMLAFGGGFDPPYTMNVVGLASGAVIRVAFESGYPGEIRWSPDGTRIAVSTYDIERTHHETWVIAPRTGEGQHLSNGCVIVWSPDSRFLAVHGEDQPGVNVFDVGSGAMLDLSDGVGDVPISWTN